ncbi:MAG: ribosome small subunit-dependent GTPase A [bacterium]
MIEKGTIIKNISNLYVVSTPLGEISCTPRGLFRYEKITPLVGDTVDIDVENKYIIKIHERTNVLSRPAVANIGHAVIVTSMKEPDFSPLLLDKLIVRFLSKNAEPILIFTKLDKCSSEDLEEYKKLERYYTSLGYAVVTNENIEKIKKILEGKIAFLAGQTGAGKSSLINKLSNDLDLKTSPISKALGRGVHTTRHTELYKIDSFFIADTPGFSSIDLSDIDRRDLRFYFAEFENFPCKFRDCEHIKGICSVMENVENGNILESRYKSYKKIHEEIK